MLALVFVAKHRGAGASADESSIGVDEPQRILGSALKHRLQGSNVPVSLSSLCFAIQGVAMVVECSAFGPQTGLGSGRPGRLFAIVVLVAPAGLLFHRPFVVGIIAPFMRVLGAI